MNEAFVSTRRQFLKTSASAAALAATTTTLIAPANVHAASDETIKIALIGCGGRGTGAASQALNTSGPIKIIAVADAFEDQAHIAVEALKREHADKVDVKDDHIFVGFDAYKHAIDSEADVIIIATSPGFRPIHFEYAVEKNKNVFMEKPVATDAPGVRRILAANEIAKKKNLKVAVGLQRHHQAGYIETIKRIQDGALGDIAKGELDMLRVYWNDGGVWVRPRKPTQTEMEYQMRNWYYFIWLCGDHINEQHIHNLDVGNWIMQGHPISAYGSGGRQLLTGIDHGQIFDHHNIEYTFANGTKMISQCRHWPNTTNNNSEHAHGTKGYCNVSGFQIKLRDGKEWSHPTTKQKLAYQVEHDDYFDAVRNNKPYNEADNGAHSTMTAILGRMATYSGAEVKWDEAINSSLDLHPVKYDFKADPTELWPDETVRVAPDANGRYWIPTPGVIRAV